MGATVAKKCSRCGTVYIPAGILPGHACPECVVKEAWEIYNRMIAQKIEQGNSGPEFP